MSLGGAHNSDFGAAVSLLVGLCTFCKRKRKKKKEKKATADDHSDSLKNERDSSQFQNANRLDTVFEVDESEEETT